MDYMPKEKTIEVWKKTNWNIVSVTCDFFFCQLQTAHTNTGKLALTLHSRRQGPLFLSVCTRFWKPEWPLFSPPLSPFAPQVLWQQLLHSYNGESFFSPQCSLDARQQWPKHQTEFSTEWTQIQSNKSTYHTLIAFINNWIGKYIISTEEDTDLSAAEKFSVLSTSISVWSFTLVVEEQLIFASSWITRTKNHGFLSVSAWRLEEAYSWTGECECSFKNVPATEHMHVY